jgi:hypothetical protein
VDGARLLQQAGRPSVHRLEIRTSLFRQHLLIPVAEIESASSDIRSQ